MLVARWDFSAAVSLQACGTLTGATVISHVRSHSCTWSPRDMETFLHPSRKGPARMSLGPSDQAVWRNDVFSLSRGHGRASQLRFVWQSRRVTTPSAVPSQCGHCTLKKEVPWASKMASVSTLPSDAHYSLRATAQENVQPLPNNVL